MSPSAVQRRRSRAQGGRRSAAAGRCGAHDAMPTLFDGGADAQTALRDRSGVRPAGHGSAAPAAVGPGSGQTLDEVVIASWERLVAEAQTPCLICGGTIQPNADAPGSSSGGHCRDCGTTLS